MSLDGQGQRIRRKVSNDRPIRHEIECPCGGTIYASPTARHARCSNGEFRCTECRREARKFGRGLTCGTGCSPHGE